MEGVFKTFSVTVFSVNGNCHKEDNILQRAIGVQKYSLGLVFEMVKKYIVLVYHKTQVCLKFQSLV